MDDTHRSGQAEHRWSRDEQAVRRSLLGDAGAQATEENADNVALLYRRLMKIVEQSRRERSHREIR